MDRTQGIERREFLVRFSLLTAGAAATFVPGRLAAAPSGMTELTATVVRDDAATLRLSELRPAQLHAPPLCGGERRLVRDSSAGDQIAEIVRPFSPESICGPTPSV
jgi:hypothetical protein